jgi:hypothetical protein
MTVVLIAFGVLVGILLAVVLPWALLRKLESKEPGDEDG